MSTTDQGDFEVLSGEALAEYRAWKAAGATKEPTRPANSQDWAGMDASTAFLLIQRHADGWADIELMMNEWRTANPPEPTQQNNCKLTECQGRERCAPCKAMDAAYRPAQQERKPILPAGHCASDWGGRPTGPCLYTDDEVLQILAAHGIKEQT